MNILSFIKLFGGLGLFIYGMMTMGNALEKLAGEKLEKTLEIMTGNIFKSIAMGALVTGVIQSSSATTVMVVGFVNAGIMSLTQAAGVIMGANIGTTVTAQLLSLESMGAVKSSFILQIMKPSMLCYVAVAAGVVLMMSTKKKKMSDLGEIFLGFGILFIGMSVMEGSVANLQDLPWFQNMFAAMKNPFLGILTGALVTAVIQSSSASVGILQAVAATGAITYSAAIPIILGQNIGTCVTAFISSLGGNKNAKRAAMIHFYFNLIGSLLFISVIYAIQYTVGLSSWDLPIGKTGIANFHTLFNVVVTFLFIPFRKWLVILAEKTIPMTNGPDIGEDLALLDKRFYSSPSVALEQCNKVVSSMGVYGLLNLQTINSAILDKKSFHIENFKENEDYIDRCEARLNGYMVGINGEELSDKSKRFYAEMMHAIGDFERIGDYADNLLDQYTFIRDRSIVFSKDAHRELQIMRQAIEEIVELTCDAYTCSDGEASSRIEALKTVIEDMKETLKNQHIHRLQTGACTANVGIPFLDIIHNYEKMANHCANIAIYVTMCGDESDQFDIHQFRKVQNEVKTEHFRYWQNYYDQRYLNNVLQDLVPALT